jgi:hypothetical protein
MSLTDSIARRRERRDQAMKSNPKDGAEERRVSHSLAICSSFWMKNALWMIQPVEDWYPFWLLRYLNDCINRSFLLFILSVNRKSI